MSLPPRFFSDVLKLPNLSTLKLSLGEAASSCGERKLAKSSSLGSDIDRVSNTLQLYSALNRPDLGSSLYTLASLQHLEGSPPIPSESLSTLSKSISTSIELSFPFEQYPDLNSSDTSHEYAHQPLPESESSSGESYTSDSDSEEEVAIM